MRRRKDGFNKKIAMLLIASILSCNVTAMAPINASTNENNMSSEADVANKEEQVIEKTLDTTTFATENGAKELVYHGSNIRYMDEDGQLIDYDPSLVNLNGKRAKSKEQTLEGYLYENKDGDMKQYLPQTLSEETPLVMTYGEHTIKFHPLIEEADSSTADNDEVASLSNVETSETSETNEFEYESTEKNTVESIYEDETVIVDTAVYALAENDVKVKYTSLSNGVKETIVLNEVPENNTFSFELNLAGMYPVIMEETNEIFIYDKQTNEVKAIIDRPFMNDSTGNAYSEDIVYTIQKTSDEDVYTLSMIVDKTYLTAEERVYPVEIDPTVTWKGSSKIDDTYVINTAPYRDTNFYADGVTSMAVGDGKQGLFRSYMNFADMKAVINNYYVDSAALTLYETGISTKGQTVQAHRVTEKWNPSTITWNNRAAYSATVLDTIKTKGIIGAAHTLDITSYARNVANRTASNYGIMLRAAAETNDTFVQLYGSRYAGADKKPKLTIIYYDGPKTADTVTVANKYPAKGEDIKIAWSGIDSKALSYVQYRVVTYDDNQKDSQESYIAYSADTKLGTASSGSKVISGSSAWKEGCYAIYVRGVDKGGIAGTGKGVVVHIDKTNPKKATASISPKTTTDKYSTEDKPVITWSGATDEHLSRVEYSINDGAFVTMGTNEKGTYTLPEGELSVSGTYKITVRTVDKSDNVTLSTPFYYWYQRPEQPATATNVKVSKSYIKPGDKLTVNWEGIDSATLAYVQYRVVSFNDETKEVATSSYISYSDATKIGTKATGSKSIDTSKWANGCYRLYVRGVDETGLIGVGKGVTIHVDNVKPKITAELALVEADENAKQQDVMLKWSIEESHLEKIEFSLNGSDFIQLSKTNDGTYVIPSDKIITGENKIVFRVTDCAQNSDSMGLTFTPEKTENGNLLFKIFAGFVAIKWFFHILFG